MLHFETVSDDLQTLIQTICQQEELANFRLVGGTALSLFMGHRISVDADFFADQYLIVIDKAIESFLLWNAQQIGLQVDDYGFINDIKLFGKALKTSAIGSDPNYLQLLTDLHTRQAPGFQTLERILNDFIIT